VTRFVRAYGLAVVEVARPDRSMQRRQGKSDPIDAQAAARATLAGVAVTTPIPASSGRTDRHRLNRGGDRQANNAFAADRLGPDALPPKLVTRPVHAGIQQPLRTGAPCVGMGWCMSPTRP
jgi:hypothetical protein